MELKGSFLQQLKIGETQLSPFVTKKRDSSLVVVGMFARETFNSHSDRWKNLEVHCNNDPNTRPPHLPQSDISDMPRLSFTRLQPTDEEYAGKEKRAFGHFVAREAIIDEEIWVASWLRAEAHWEHMANFRNIDSYKKRFADAEFDSLKRRCSGKVGNSLQCYCFVTVKKEDKNIKRTVLKSVVGTMDMSIRQFIHGETYPDQAHRRSAVMARQEPFHGNRYAYVANMSVAKYARRQGIASNMLYLAMEMAKNAGMKNMFVHVTPDNFSAQQLYKKLGFRVVDRTLPVKEELILMSLQL